LIKKIQQLIKLLKYADWAITVHVNIPA